MMPYLPVYLFSTILCFSSLSLHLKKKPKHLKFLVFTGDSVKETFRDEDAQTLSIFSDSTHSFRIKIYYTHRKLKH